MILQLDASGQVIVQRAIVELLALRQEIVLARTRIQELEAELKECRREGAREMAEVVQPLWDTAVYQLPRHVSKLYERRPLSEITRLVITHSAAPSTLSPEVIARFHVNQMGWPGIGYHYYIDGSGALFQCNDLTTIAYHVREWNAASLSICVAGNFTGDIPTPSQISRTAHLLAWLLQELELPLDAIVGKSELIDTQSPGRQWLSGKRWKDMLLNAVSQAQDRQAQTHPLKSLYHYLLFWQRDTDWAREDWQGAQSYIGRFRVTHGFSVEEAQQARYVSVVGGSEGIDEAAERTLLRAGCRVERIAGLNPSETRQILTGMADRDQRFVSLAG